MKQEKGRGKADKIKQFWIVNAIAVNASPELIDKLSMRDDIASIELDSKLHVLEDFSVQVSQGQIDNATPEIKRINATKVWELGIDGSGINVSVIDTGINASHPDIAGRVIKWVDFVNGNNALAYDDNGHGTHVAGTVGGNGNKGNTTGVAPNVSLFGVKVLNAAGSGSESNVIYGIEWSVINGANVISMSIGTTEIWTTSNCDVDNPAMATAINNALASGVVVVAAAGNNASGVSSPGCIQNVTAVGAVNTNDSIAFFSGRGAAMTDHGVVAPGVDILSLRTDPYNVPYTIYNNYYAYLSGTSMATPHVAGTVALLLQAANKQGTTLTPAQIKNIFNSTSIDLGDIGNDPTYGAGRINVSAAVLSIDAVGPNVIANPTGYIGSNTAAKNGTAITLNATIADAVSGVKNATVNVSSINASLTNISLINVSGFWINSSVIVNASDGIYYLNITAYDNVSNVNNTVQLTIKIDNTPPRVTAYPTGYVGSNTAAKNGTAIILNATITDAVSGVRNATVNVSSINASLTNISFTNDSGFSNVIVNTSDGTYHLNITAYDNAGNKNDTVQFPVIVDNTPPSNITINPVSYQRGIAANTGSIMTFNISASDPVINSTSSGMRNASVNASMINNTGWITLTNQSGFWKGNSTVDKSIPDGNYSLNVTFFDNAGNINSSEWINITIDNTPPLISFIDAFPSLIEVGGVTYISVFANDNFELNTSEVYARIRYPNGTSIDYRMTYLMRFSAFGYTFTDTMQYGRFNITIIANDTTGNTNSSVTTWIVTTKSNNSLVLIHGGYDGITANDTTLWDAANFPGLVVGETLNVQNVSNRTIPQGNLWYNTSRQIVQYTLNSEKSLLVENALDGSGNKGLSGGYYAKVGWQGIPYVAFNGKVNKTSLLILEQSSLLDKKTMVSRETWDMGSGYALKAEAIDSNTSPRQVWFNLSKNGVRLDDKVLNVSDAYNFSINSTAGETNIPLFVTYVDSIFAGVGSDMVQLKYTWLISDNVTVINASDPFGNLTVVQSNSSFMNLTNSFNISLAQNSNIDLMDKLHFKANDNASLEYYPYFDSPASVNATLPADVTLEIFRDSGAAGSIKATKYSNITPEMNQSLPETPFSKYISIETNNNIINNRTWLKFKVYYTQAELTVSGLDESSLKLAWYNESTDSWITLNAGSPVWVYGTGADTSDSGGYAGHVWVNITNFSAFGSVAFDRSTFDFGIFALIGTPSAAPVSSTNTGSPGGGGGGGGGGGTSAENYSNIESKEKRDNYVFKDKVASYKFNTTDPIMYVNITGNISAGDVTTMVEVLRNTSTLVKNTSAPGLVYKNMNIWVGTSGFATPKNMKQGVVGFRVKNSWLEEKELAPGDVRLVKWNGSGWIELDTYETTKGSEHVYYEAVTDSFSPFAITAIRSAPQPVEAIKTSVTANETPAPEKIEIKREGTSGLNGILLVTAVVLVIIVAILAAVYLKEKKKI